MYYSSQKLYLAKSQIVTVRPQLQSCRNAFTLVRQDCIIITFRLCKLWARKKFYVICTGDYNTGFLDWCPLTSAAITLLPNTLQYRFQILHWEI